MIANRFAAAEKTRACQFSKYAKFSTVAWCRRGWELSIFDEKELGLVRK
jgi:hypothetical protein